MSEISKQAVDALFADVRDRRFLKWLFNPEGAEAGPITHFARANGTIEELRPLDLWVQQEIAEAWESIIEQTERAAYERLKPQSEQPDEIDRVIDAALHDRWPDALKMARAVREALYRALAQPGEGEG